MYSGDYTPAKTVVFNFNTASFADGSPITLAGTPALSVYKNSTTESTSGVTLTVDYDSRTGMHHVAIDTSSDGTFYAAGNDFDVIITTGTVGGTSVVGRKVGSFSLSNRSALRPTVADRTADVSVGGEMGIDWANVGSPTTALALTNTTIATTQKVDVETIKTNPVVNAGTVTFPTTATLASTTNITAGTITTTTNLTNLPSIPANWLTAAGTAADFGAEMATAVWTDTTAGDFTVALSVGKSVMNGVTLGTGLTVARCTLTDTTTNLTNLPATAALEATSQSIITAIAALHNITAADVVTAVFAQAIESGVSFLQALRAIAAKSAGILSGAGTGTEVLKGIGQTSSGTTRATATVDASGNITDYGLNL